MAEAIDPFYPYFMWLDYQIGSTDGESCVDEEAIPYWRALLPSESGLDHSLRKLPPDVVRRLRSNNKEGRAHLAQGEWLPAEECFLLCKHMLLSEEAELEQLLGKQAFEFLVAWAVLPLAHVYQSQFESTDMLKKAVEVREEVLRRVSPSRGSHPELVRVCETYYHTARYEWGKASSSEADVAAAVRDYATLELCAEDEAHAQLCYLLGVNHLFSGCFVDHELGASLRWTQEAYRLWTKNAGDENRFYSQLAKSDDSEFVLEDQEMLQECRTQLGRSDLASEGISEEARHGRSPLQEHDFVQDDDSVLRNEEAEWFGIPAYHPILGRTPPILGSSLGLRKATDDILAHEVRKLPRPICDILHWLSTRDNSYDETHRFEQLKEFLLSAKGSLDGKTYDWFLSYYDLSLADIYLYRVGKPEQALELWTELMNCVRSQIPHKYMTKGYDMMSNAVRVFVKYASDGHVQWSGDNAMPRGHGERDISMFKSWSQSEKNESFCWLYFGNWKDGKLEDALKWLRRVKLQKAMISSEEDHSVVCDSKLGYICCVYEYLLCEIDLLMRLGRFEEAIPRLNKLLITKQVQQGPRRLARQAKHWLNFCTFFHAGTSPVGIEPEYYRDEADWPYPTVCASDELVKVHRMPCVKLVQCQTGLEYHLQMLPVPYRLAVRYHGILGTSFLKKGQWDKAIFELEWCRELLSLLHQWLSPGIPPVVERACSWLSVWVAVPLAEIYHIRKLDFKTAFQLQMEIFRKAEGFKEESEEVQIGNISLTWIYAALYQYAESSKDPILKQRSLEHLEKLRKVCAVTFQIPGYSDRPRSKPTVLLAGGYFRSIACIELVQLMIIFIQYFAHSEYVVALTIAQQVKQLLEIRYSKHEEFLDALREFVVYEAECFLCLHKPSEAKAVLDSFHRRTGLIDKDLPKSIKRQYRKVADAVRLDPRLQAFDILYYGRDQPLPTQLPPEIVESMRKIRGFMVNREFAEAIKLSKELVIKTCKSAYRDPSLSIHFRLYADLICDWDFLDEKSSSLRFDELNAICEGETVKSSLIYLVELTEHPSTTRELASSLYTVLVTLQVIIAHRYYIYFQLSARTVGDFNVEAFNASIDREEWNDELHKQHRQFLSQVRIIQNEAVSYLRKENSVERYSNEAIEQFEVTLESAARSKQHSESWIEVLQAHRVIYSHLQHYHLFRVHIIEVPKVYAKFLGNYGLTLSSEGKTLDYSASVKRHKWNAFLHSEAERTRVMMYQLGFQKPNFKSRWAFIDDDHRNMDIIQRECANILEEGSVFVEYSLNMFDNGYNIYVLHQNGILNTHRASLKKRTTNSRRFERMIKDLYTYFEPSKKPSKCSTMKEDLEFLYEILIEPIAEELAQMKPEHKLIFSENELLTKVPFAALRNKKDQTYLIEHHTIAIAPSLKVLQFCQQRLTELRESPLKKRGSIVALGDPKYDCVSCTKERQKGRRKDLKWTRREVEHIDELFGDAAVIKLLQGDATKEQLRLCTSELSFRQAILHTGAHGVIDESTDRYMKSTLIQLACPPCSMEADVSSSSSTNTSSDSIAGGQAANNALRNEVDGGDEEVSRDSFDDNDDISDQDESDELHSGGLHESMKMMFGMLQRASEGASSSESALVGRGDAGFRRQSETCHDLTINEISVDMQMRVELVVLSACQTARGRTTMEGVLSLARAFMVAGVPSVVASLWKVDDEATCALMKVFYDELRRGKDVASALRSSMLERMKLSPDAVREWAPFNVLGVPSLQLPTELLQNLD